MDDATNPLKVLGGHIRSRRLRQKVTQQRLANLMNVEVRQVQRWESGAGSIPVQKLCQLARLLKTNVWVLTYGIDDGIKLPAAKPDEPLKRKPSLPVEQAEYQSFALEAIRLQKSRDYWTKPRREAADDE